MAAIAACSVPVAGLCGSTVTAAPAKRNVQFNSAFVTGSSDGVFTGSTRIFRPASNARTTCFARDWLRKDLTVIGFSVLGWLAPSSIPAIKGESLSGLFFSSIGPELAKFPVGPSLDSPFWLWLILWHTGLFTALLLGQIGFKARKDGYFN